MLDESTGIISVRPARGSYFALIFSWHQKHILLRQQALQQQLFPHNLYVAHFSHLHSVVNCAKVHCRLVQLVYATRHTATPANQAAFFARFSAFMQMRSFSSLSLDNSIRFSFATRHQIYLSFQRRRSQERIFLSLPVVEMCIEAGASPRADFIAAPKAWFYTRPSLERNFSPCKRYRDDEFFHSAGCHFYHRLSSFIPRRRVRKSSSPAHGANEGNLLSKLAPPCWCACAQI